MESQPTPEQQQAPAFDGTDTPEFQDEEAPALEAHEPSEMLAYEEQPMAQPVSSGGFLPFALSATGFFMATGGAALAVGPRYSWQAEKAVRELSAMGVEAGAFLAGGVVLFALGWVLRAVYASRQIASPKVDNEDDFNALTEAFEELATDLAMFRESILQVATHVEQNGQNHAAFQEQLRADLSQQRTAQGEAAKTGQNEAVFRLAASLDQLNARVDERIHHMDAQLRGQFQTMNRAVEQNRDDLDASLRALSTQIQSISVPAPAPPPVEPEAPAGELMSQEPDEFRLDPGPEEMEILVDLEEPVVEEPELGEDGPMPPALDFDALDVCDPAPTTAPFVEPPPVRPDPAPEAEVQNVLDSLLPDETINQALDRDRHDEG